MQTIFPILRYTDARAAIRWLCAVFGFREIFSVPESGEFVRHAQLSLGTNLIMLGSCRDDDGLKSPKSLGAATQALCVYVPDVDEHFEKLDWLERRSRRLRKIRTSDSVSITCAIPKATAGLLGIIYRKLIRSDR